MTTRSLIFLFFLCILSIPSLAQHITISGYVTDKNSGERLTGAVVFIPSLQVGTSSNTFGFYSITIPAGADSVDIKAAYVGYAGFEQRIGRGQGMSLDIAVGETKELKEVVVSAAKTLQERTQMSAIDLPIQTVKSLPAFLGEPDIMKAIQLLPGIQGGNEGTSGLYVRGGSPDQNLILLDGVPVYNASHLFGFFSVFNADAIRNVEVIKGGFPARYGGRLSSVIDINMKEGDKNKIHGEGGIGLVASRLTLEGPIKKDKASFMVSGRRTYIDVLAAPFMRGSSKGGYYFYDLNGKANFTLGKKDHLYVSGYFGNDKFYFSDKSSENGNSSSFAAGIKWGNATAVGRWNHEFSPKTFGNLTTYYSQYRFSVTAENGSVTNGASDDFLLKMVSGINDAALKYDLDIIPSPNHYLKTGIGAIAHTYTPGAQTTKVTNSGGMNMDTTIGQSTIHSTELDAYVEDDIRFSAKLKANIGLHLAGFQVRDKFYTSLQPRVAVRYLINEKMSAKASFVQMNQYINLLTNSSVGLPTDLWVPSTDKIPPQLSRQGAVGIAYTYDKGYEVSVEGYYKTMDNIIEYKEGAGFFNSTTSWEDKIECGRGTSYGGELFVQKKKGKFTGMLGYTLSWTNRTFANLNNGETFPYKYDRRHDFKVAGVYTLSKRIEMSAEWVYGTGNAITLPIGYYQAGNGQEITIYGSRNGYRMPSYHRGDVSIRFSKEKTRYTRSWILGAYNVYNRKNPFFIYQENGKFKQVSLFPIIPSISYQFKF
ncbi:TonB-dependent receptor [Nemorincola caseinilytica]|uniref:TonB-dependent receptor n=1 Tax=Nemorincola caseinilytica TaxID=2054315 RepID=A0ABP8NID0_9BACT